MDDDYSTDYMPPQNTSDPTPQPEETTLPRLTGRPSRPAIIALVTIGCLLAIVMFGIKNGPFNGLTIQERQKNACINNLRQIDGAKQTWALEFKAAQTATPTWQQLSPFLKSTRTEDTSHPKCPAGGIYTINNILLAPTCSIHGHTLE